MTGSKESRGVNFKDGICADFFNKNSSLKATCIFAILLCQDDFESDYPEIKFQAITSSSQFEKVPVQKFIANLWTVISNEMIKYQLPIRGSIKLVIINLYGVQVSYTCMESYPLSY